MLSSSASSSSAVQNSGQSHSSMQQSSRQLVASKLESSKTASNNHALYNESGVFLLENDAIDTEDVSAEMKLRDYLSYDVMQSSDGVKINMYARGNTIVEEVYFQDEKTDAEISEAASYADSFSNDETLKKTRDDMRKDSGVSGAQWVEVQYTKDGRIMLAFLVND